MNALLDKYLDWLDLSGHAGAENLVESWHFEGWHENGELAAVAMLKGTENHYAVAPNWRGRIITRRRTRAFLAPLMERYGFLTTRSFDHDNVSALFLCRLGFIKTWTELHFHHWMLTELPFSRGH